MPDSLPHNTGVDWQSAFNIAVLIIGAMGGWLFLIMRGAQNQLRSDLRELEKSIPDTYARRDDLKHTIDALFAKLDRIEEKLDKKADK